MNKLSLFSGILGDDLASEWAGIKTVCCVEIDSFCQKIIKKHFPDMPVIGDIQDVTKEKVKEVSGYEWVDIISGGDPCQPRSIAGKRRGREDDRDLWEDMFRVICEFKPTWVVNENPTGRLTMDFHEVLSDLESQGYETRSFVIPACAVNAPHRRDRLYIVAYNESRRQQGRAKQSSKTSPNGGLDVKRRGDDIVTNSQSSTNRFNQTEQEGWSNNPRQPKPTPNPDTEGLQGFGQSGECARELITAQGAWQELWLEVATAFCGVDDGFSNRVARLKALGNAQVPQQVYPIYKAIVEVENMLALEP